ncbi:MAG: hypothetical protein LBJ59_03155 [Zoogloeaceae bacterium]|jgi:hypothetical protein|nr:hypothetical protein [Zoogloeaceae bacterium]
MNALTQNPEFRRNLWLEFSPQRLFLMPAVILLTLFVISKFSVGNGKTLSEIILSLSLAGFIGLTAVWGCVQTSNALGHEFSDGVWDSQRMSSLTPWQMTWGKLLGGSLYAWYGGGILLLVALFAAGAGTTKWSFPDVLRGCVGLALLALLMQTLSMMRTLLLWQRHPGKTRGRVSIIGALILFWLLGSFFVSFFMGKIRDTHIQPIDLLWYGGMKAGMDFMLLSLFALAVWAVIGLWQLMRRELLLRNRPWWWLTFLLFWMLWSAGFITQLEQGQEKIWAIFFVFSAALTWMSVYLLIFLEKKDQAFWIRLIAAWRRRDSELLQHLLPNWLVSFALALVFSLIALLLALPELRLFSSGLLFLVSIVAFVLRDTAWILWLNLAPGARWPDGAALVSLAVAYGILPQISARLFLPSPSKAWFQEATFTAYLTAPLTIHLVFAAAALWLLYSRFRKTFDGK